jgi:Rod binding domain-containing protein
MPMPTLAASAAVAAGRAVVAKLAPQAQRAVAAAREFESVYLAQALNGMTSNIGQGSGFDGGHAEAQWRTMMNEHLARHLAAAGGIGLADSVARELLRGQEGRS